MFGIFNTKKRLEKLREEVQESFIHVKKDMDKIGDWIKHLDDKKKENEEKVKGVLEEIKKIKEEIEEIKGVNELFGQHLNTQQRTKNININSIKGIQTTVQTGVQTEEINKLSIMERAIVWALLNSEMKMSYEDIAVMLGKEKSTIRGQVNSIKQKIPNLISEHTENNGKKRIYIDEFTKKSLIKRSKIKINEKN